MPNATIGCGGRPLARSLSRLQRDLFWQWEGEGGGEEAAFDFENRDDPLKAF